MKKNADGRAEALKQKKNKILGKQIKDKLKGAMYEIAKVQGNKEFKSIDALAQKNIIVKKKKLMSYEKKANLAIEGKDIDCTIDEVAVKVKEASNAVALVDKLIATSKELTAACVAGA